MEVSRGFFIIKPDAFEYANEILDIITKSPLKLDAAYDVILPKKFIVEMYNDPENKFKMAAAEYNSEKHCIVGFVSGTDSPGELVKLCGASFKSHLCAPGTIRYEFQVGGPIEVNGVMLERNAIHRSDAEEVAKDICLFNSYLGSGKFTFCQKIR